MIKDLAQDADHESEVKVELTSSGFVLEEEEFKIASDSCSQVDHLQGNRNNLAYSEALVSPNLPQISQSSRLIDRNQIGQENIATEVELKSLNSMHI